MGEYDKLILAMPMVFKISQYVDFCRGNEILNAQFSFQYFEFFVFMFMFDSLPSEQRDDKLALVYESNRNTLMAVNTAVGLTDRVNVERVVTQGGVFGSLKSNSIDTIGKKCFNSGEHLFTYKKIVKI